MKSSFESMEIIQASAADTGPILALIREAVKLMLRNGIDQWDENYPGKKVVSEDIAAGTLYKLTIDGNIAGVLTLNENQSPEYLKVPWGDNHGRYLVVHRVCVHPDYQRKGIARRLMLFAEDYAKENGYSSIRLDTYDKNHIALNLYRSLHYKPVGDVSLRLGKNFHCFEKAVH